MHNIDLNNYYQNCLKLLNLNKNTCILVFSNDINYCKNMDILKNLNIVFVEDENEINSLYLMSLCKLGGICGNSTFAWWGAYLNENEEKTVMFPDKWFNNNWTCDIYPKNSIIVST
jgi:hypothetical protein